MRIDTAKIRGKLFPRRKPLDRPQEIRRLVELHRSKNKEGTERLYQKLAEFFEIAFGEHEAGNQARSWDYCVRCFTIWGLITEVDWALEELKTGRFSKEEVQKVIEDIDLS